MARRFVLAGGCRLGTLVRRRSSPRATPLPPPRGGVAQFRHFRLRVWLYLHIDFGVRVRSPFQHSGAALPAPPLGGRCSGWSCFFRCLQLGGAAWPPSLFFSVVLPSFPAFGWVFPSLQLGGAAWLPPSLGRGALPPHMMVWVLGGWVVRWVVCWVVWLGVGVWLLSAGWGVCWVAKRMGGRGGRRRVGGVFSVWIGVEVFLKACFLVWLE